MSRIALLVSLACVGHGRSMHASFGKSETDAGDAEKSRYVSKITNNASKSADHTVMNPGTSGLRELAKLLLAVQPLPTFLLSGSARGILAHSPSFTGSKAVGLHAHNRLCRRGVPNMATTWQQTMLRVKDPDKSLKFYNELLGMRLLDKLDFEQFGFSLYFLASVPAGEETPEPGTTEAHKYLWTFPGTVLELTHNYGTETEESFTYHAGNKDSDGFGHVAFSVEDVYASSAELEKTGVAFQKKPDEGRMKGLAFALDPDGYWVELVRGGGRTGLPYTLAQTMLRVKDPVKSIEFYTKHLGMTLLSANNCGDFSLYFLGTVPEGETELPPGQPVLELTHNHGTENDADFKHFTGNEDGRKGFGHIGFLVDDVYKTCDELVQAGYEMQKAPDGGSMKGLAFARDPDGYWVEIVKRGGYDSEATPYFLGEQ